ncbi:MAG TPA: phenylalanine--tRNA ligase beta subunit-related protein [Syntrophorhabdaceae bacterium]|nr:phenylalanine--tRNA ligase beta subunit-related protein [Syntrophorhabdaceae bacterium]
MIFSVSQDLFHLFPSLKIGVLVAEIDNTKYGDDHLEDVLENLKSHFSLEKPQDHEHVKVWRDAFKKLGISAAKYQSSVESLLRRALKGGPFPRINPLVDLYNAQSIKHLVPVGGHALEPIEGNIQLCFAQGHETFVPMDSGEQEVVEKNEVIYRDNASVLTRRWVWRQSNKDKVLSETTRIFIPIDVMEGLPHALCQDVVKDMEESIVGNGYGKVIHRDIITKDRLETEFNF